MQSKSKHLERNQSGANGIVQSFNFDSKIINRLVEAAESEPYKAGNHEKNEFERFSSSINEDYVCTLCKQFLSSVT